MSNNDNKNLVPFLRKVLETRLGLSEHEAAKIGIHLYNLLKKQGRDVGYLAYWDEGGEKFRWAEGDQHERHEKEHEKREVR